MFHVVCINDDWLGAEHEGAVLVPQVVFPKKGVVYTVKKTVIGCIKQRVMYHLYEINYEGLCFTYKGNNYIGLGFPVEHFRPLQKLTVEQFTTRPVKKERTNALR